MGFDAQKYKELHGQGDAGKKEGGKQKPEKKAQPKKQPEPEPEPEEEAAPVEPPFCMDSWKKKYRNNPTSISIPYFYENFDPKEYSIWRCDYERLEDIPPQGFMCANLISGMMQRLDCIRKNAFGLIGYYGSEKNHTIHGIWFWKCPGNIFDGRDDLVGDHLSYKWAKFDVNNAKDKKYINEFLECEGDYEGRGMYKDIKMFV